MARILLVYPDIKSYAPRVPITLLHLAAFLIRSGIEVEIFDDQVQDYHRIDPNSYDYIGFSIRTGIQIANALKIARSFRQQLTKTIPFIWGGVHATILPEETLQNEYVDYVVLYEGEETLVDLVKTLESKGDRRRVKGIMYVENGILIQTENRPFIDIDDTPPLPYHLIDNRCYIEIQRSPKQFYIVTSRGCPYKCGFCLNEKLRNSQISLMGPERVADQFQDAIHYCQPDILHILDDESFVSKKRVEDICRELIRRGIQVKWTGTSRINWIHRYENEFFDLLEKSGFQILSLGAESGSTSILQKIDKRITLEDMIQTAERLKGRNITCWINFMVGFPDETMESLSETFHTIDQLIQINSNFLFGISVYTPYPCTPLYPAALAKGFVPPRCLEEWGTYHYNTVQNLPWIKGRLRSIIRTIGSFSKFGFHRPEIEKYPFNGNWIFRAAFFLLQVSAKYRWKHKFFAFPIEWRIFEMYLNLTKVYDR